MMARARHPVGSYDDLAVGAARYVPDFEKRWQAYARPVGDSWRVDETYMKVKGQWVTCTGLSIKRAARSTSA
jgi:transposase-like protein